MEGEHRLKHSIPTLLSLLKIREFGSISQAAESLHLSQSALTRSLLKFERTLGVKIVERSGRGVTLNQYGELLAEHAAAIDAEIAGALRGIDVLRGKLPGGLRLGTQAVLVTDFLPAALQAVHETHPSVPIQISQGLASAVIGQLRRRELDLAILIIQGGSEEEEIVLTPLFKFELCVIARPGHPLVGPAAVDLKVMAQYQWILPRADSAFHRQVHGEFKRAGVSFPGAVIELALPHAIANLVMSSDMLGIVPVHSVTDALRTQTLLALRGDWTFGPRTVSAVYRRDAPPQSAGAELVAQLRQRYV